MGREDLAEQRARVATVIEWEVERAELDEDAWFDASLVRLVATTDD